MATEKKGQQQINPTAAKMKRNGGKIAGIIIAVVCILAVVYSILSSFGLPQQVFPVASSTQGNVTVAQYNYYYKSLYQNYYQMKQIYSTSMDVDFAKDLAKQPCTIADKKEDGSYPSWQEFLETSTLDKIYETEILYAMAVKDKKADLTTEEQKAIDDQIKTLRDDAKEAGYSFDAMLRSPKSGYGKGVTEALVRRELKKTKVAENYKTTLKDAQTSFTKEDYKKFYEQHKEDYNTISLYTYKAKNEDIANDILNQLDATGSNFDSVVTKEDSSKTTTNLTQNATYSAVKSLGISEEGVNWICSTDRKAGDRKVFKTESGSEAVAVLIKTPYQLDVSNTVDVRHILIKPEETDGKTATTAQWDAAKKKAENLLNEWRKGAKTEESFGELAKKNSSDTGSTDNGGLYEHVTKGQMVAEFENWIFDQNRKAGDTGIVKTEYGYHVMYYVKTNVPYWEYQVSQDIKTNVVTTKVEEAKKEYNYKENKFFIKFTTHLPKDMV